MVWQKTPPPPSEMWRHYGELYDLAVTRAGKDVRLWQERRNAITRRKSEGSVLDIGCSSGGFLSVMQGPKWKLFGIEMSEATANEARRNTGAEVFVGDILDAPFAPESFDVITCFHVFEHVYQPKEMLAKVYQWLKPGGIFHLEVPNIDALEAGIFRSYWHSLELPRHLYHYSPATIRRLLAGAGLVEVQLETTKSSYGTYSIRYVVDDLFSRLGRPRPPAAAGRPPSFVSRAIRKLNRLTIFALVAEVAAALGRGPDLKATFQK
jgi:SAM-dependent methyltransferase